MIVHQVKYLPMLLISRLQKQPLRTNDNYTHQKGWEIFLEEKLITGDLQYIWFFSCWFFSIKKSRKLEVVFPFWRTKCHDQIQCQMSIANKSEN